MNVDKTFRDVSRNVVKRLATFAKHNSPVKIESDQYITALGMSKWYLSTWGTHFGLFKDILLILL